MLNIGIPLKCSTHLFYRYTLFIALYPLGVTGEMLCYFTALPVVQKHRYLSVPLPNQLNFAFDSYYAFIVVIVMYIPGESY